MTDLIFDAPLWLPTAFAVLGAVLLFSGNRRQEKKLMAVGGAALAAAVVVAAVSYAVDTPTEAAVARTRGLVAAVAGRDWPRVRELLDPETSALSFRGPEAIARAAEAGADRVGLKSASVIGLTAERNDTDITVDVTALSEQNEFPYPARSSWRLVYQDRGDGWLLYEISILPDGNVTPEAVERRVR